MQQTLFILFLLLATCTNSFAQRKAKIDSLIQASLVAKDTTRIKILVELCWAYRNSSIDTAILYGKTAIEQSLAINYKLSQPKNYTYLGVLYRNQGDYTKALKNYFLAARISEEIKNYEQLGYALQSIGDVNNRQGDYEEAIKYTQQGLAQFEAIKDHRGIGYCEYTLGNIYYNKKDYTKALEYHYKALALRRQIKDKGNVASSLGIISTILYKQQRITESLQVAIEAEVLFKETNDLRGLANMLNQVSRIEFDKKAYDISIDKAKEALVFLKKSGSMEYRKDSYFIIFQAYQAKKDLKAAFDNQKLYLLYEDSLLSQERTRQTLNIESAYYQEKQDLRLAALKNESESRTVMIYAAAIITVIILILVILFIRATNKRKKTTILLKEQAEEILNTTEELAVTLEDINGKNTKINDSIGYALRIQTAILLSEKDLQKSVAKSFILFKPRDIVSGDFYWFAEKPNVNTSLNSKKIILVVADCTGHGVPGAFMSMIGDSLLKQIVHDKEIHEPHKILDLLDIGVRNALHQDQTSQNDGMDISIVSLHYQHEQVTKLQFSGAMNPAYLVEHRPNETIFHTLKADKKPIGGNTNLYKRKKAKADLYLFTNQNIIINQEVIAQTLNETKQNIENNVENSHDLVIQSPFTLYMCSDGFQDQFGGIEDRKFMTSHFKTLLNEISLLPIQEQKNKLDTVFEIWKQDTKQTDDITIIGMKI